MSSNRQDPLDLATLEVLVAAAIKATAAPGLIETQPAIFHAVRTASQRSSAMAAAVLRSGVSPMPLYQEDVADLASLETQLAAAIRATNPGGLLEQRPALWHAVRTCALRATALATIAATLPLTPVATPTPSPTPTPGPTPSPTPTPSPSQTTMPAANPNGSYAATGNVANVDYDQNPPGSYTPSWNQRFLSDQKTDSLGLFSDQSPQSSSSPRLPWYLLARTGNMADANGNGATPNPTNSGRLPDAVMKSNHTNYANYPILDGLAGLNPNYAYDLLFFGSRQQSPSQTQYDLGYPGQALVGSQVLDDSYNTSRVLIFPKVRPAPNGVIYWTWYVPKVNGAFVSDFCCLGAMVATEFAPA